MQEDMLTEQFILAQLRRQRRARQRRNIKLLLIVCVTALAYGALCWYYPVILFGAWIYGLFAWWIISKLR